MRHTPNDKHCGTVVSLAGWAARFRHPKREGRLLVSRLGGAVTHSLCGETVVRGEALELRRADGTWVAGRYEWSYRVGESPFLFVEEGRAFELAAYDVLRWPRIR